MIKSNQFLAAFLSLSLVLVQANLCQGQARVSGGEPTIIEYAPFVVQILKYGQLFCGGTLVSQYFVVTACHCTHAVDEASLMVKGGATYLFHPGVTSLVSKILQPAHFSPQILDFDVAVLKLATAMKGPLINPISLSTTEVKHGDSAKIYGWGRTKDSLMSYQLLTADISVVDANICKSMYTNIISITENMFCAYAPGRSTCTGDSGGPIVVRGKFAGIVSFGINCGVGNHLPSVYTKVHNVLPFIKKCMQM